MKLEKGKCKVVVQLEGKSLEWDVGRICPVLLDLEGEEARDLMIASIAVGGDALNLFCLSEADALKLAGEIAEGLMKTV